MKTITSLVAITMFFGFSLAHGFDAWESDVQQPSFQAFGGSGTGMTPWFSSSAASGELNIWSSASPFQNGLPENFERPSLEGGILEDWTFFGPPGTSVDPSQSDLVLSPLLW